MATLMRAMGTPVSRACISISVTPHEETAARNASLLVRASGCGRDEESNATVAPCALFTARPMVPLLWERAESILRSLLMVSPFGGCRRRLSLAGAARPPSLGTDDRRPARGRQGNHGPIAGGRVVDHGGPDRQPGSWAAGSRVQVPRPPS